MTKREAEILENLKTFRDLSANQKVHKDLLKEKKIILYAATLLESDNVNILGLCLDILENFIANEEAHEFLVSTFGIYEALETLAIRVRNKNEDIHNRAIEITDILRNSAPPAYNTRNRGRANKPLKRHQLFLLFIEELNEKNRENLERSLIKIKGVISILIDAEMKRCTLRICPRTNIKEVIKKISTKCGLDAVIITKKEGSEAYHDILRHEVDKSYLEYPEEVQSSKTTAVAAPITDLPENINILKSVIKLWNQSFYW